jgi:hypothetical protein
MAKAKYNFAGVQIFSNSFDENIIIYINIFIFYFLKFFLVNELLFLKLFILFEVFFGL